MIQQKNALKFIIKCWGAHKMVSVCFYFQVHQPYRLRNYPVFDIGKNHNYFDEKKNREILNKVANKCYLPTNKIMLDLLKKHPEFKNR